MKKIMIGGKEYTFEFTIEATLYDTGIEEVLNQMIGLGVVQAEADSASTMEERMNVVRAYVREQSSFTRDALSMFYAGLVEHHGADGDIDHSIQSKGDAKALLRKYLDENEDLDMYMVYTEMIEEIGKDNFFKKVGYDKMFQMPGEKKAPKTPQDHKKKERVGEN